VQRATLSRNNSYNKTVIMTA